MDPGQVSIWVALGAGVLSFFSPCVLPMVPVYLLYMTGAATAASAGAPVRSSFRWRALAHAAFFVVGFGLVFVVGGITVGFLGSIMPRVMGYLVNVGGLLLIVFGLHMTGLISVPFLNAERRMDLRAARGPAYGRSFVMGVVFAAGWTPCIGPALGGILSLAAASGTATAGAVLLTAYSAGIAVPFLAVAALSDAAGPWLRRFARYSLVASRAAGVLLVIMGLLLVTGSYQQIIFRLNALASSI